MVNLIVHNFIKHGSQCTRHGQEASVPAKGRQWCGQELCPAPPHPPCRARPCCSHGSCFAPARVHRKEPKCHRANISCTQGAAPRSAGEQRLLTDIALRKAAQGKENERKATFSIKILWQRLSSACLVLSFLPGSCSRLCFCLGVARLPGLPMLGGQLLTHRWWERDCKHETRL